MSPGAPGSRIGGLDALRGLAALAVFVCHIVAYWGALGFPHAVIAISQVGAHGVDVFVVLSGFVLMLPLVAEGRTLNVGQFYGRRMWRILPAYWTALAFAAVLAVGPTWPSGRGTARHDLGRSGSRLGTSDDLRSDTRCHQRLTVEHLLGTVAVSRVPAPRGVLHRIGGACTASSRPLCWESCRVGGFARRSSTGRWPDSSAMVTPFPCGSCSSSRAWSSPSCLMRNGGVEIIECSPARLGLTAARRHRRGRNRCEHPGSPGGS